MLKNHGILLKLDFLRYWLKISNVTNSNVVPSNSLRMNRYRVFHVVPKKFPRKNHQSKLNPVKYRTQEVESWILIPQVILNGDWSYIQCDFCLLIPVWINLIFLGVKIQILLFVNNKSFDLWFVQMLKFSVWTLRLQKFSLWILNYFNALIFILYRNQTLSGKGYYYWFFMHWCLRFGFSYLGLVDV